MNIIISYWLMLAFVLCIIGIGFGLMISWKVVFGDTEKQCLDYRSSEMIKLSSANYGNCDWVIDKFMYNGSGFHVASHSIYSDVSGSSTQYGGVTSTTMYEYWVLTRK